MSRTGPRAALVAICAVALVNFLWGAGELSYFGDETFSIDVAREPLGDPMLDHLRATEIAPLAYYVLLHAWIEVTGAAREIGLRLPSVLAGLALVVATWRLAGAVGSRAVSVAAAMLVATSPLVLTYAQQVRAYALVMLLVTAAAAAAVAAARGGPRALGWASALLCAGAAWTHYTALPVVAAIVGWSIVSSRRSRESLVQAGVVALAVLLVAPLARAQFARGSEDHDSARLSWRTAHEVIGTPFDGRDIAPLWLAAAGAIVVAAAVALQTAAARSVPRPAAARAPVGAADISDERSGGAADISAARLAGGVGLSDPRVLVLACGVGPVLLLLVLAVAGADVLWSRYTAVAAPFLAVVIGLAADSPQRRARLLPLLAVVLAVAGSVRAHSRPGQFPATRAVVEAAAADWRRGDRLVLTLDFAVNASLQHYGRRELPPGAPLEPPVPETLERPGARLWIVSPRIPRGAFANLLPAGAELRRVQVFEAAAPLQLTLVTTPPA